MCTPLCLIVGGGGQSTDFEKKTPQIHLIIIKEWPKNTFPPILRNLDNFPQVHFIWIPLELGTKEYIFVWFCGAPSVC